jgi:hypothetical protein
MIECLSGGLAKFGRCARRLSQHLISSCGSDTNLPVTKLFLATLTHLAPTARSVVKETTYKPNSPSRHQSVLACPSCVFLTVYWSENISCGAARLCSSPSCVSTKNISFSPSSLGKAHERVTHLIPNSPQTVQMVLILWC